MLLLQGFVTRTRLGRAMRATAQDQQAGVSGGHGKRSKVIYAAKSRAILTDVGGVPSEPRAREFRHRPPCIMFCVSRIAQYNDFTEE